MAVANYHQDHGVNPPAWIADADGKPLHSWRVLLLPYLDQKNLYDRYDFSQAWNSRTNAALAAEMPRLYAFHGTHRPGLTTTNYLAVVGESTAWPGAEQRTLEQLTDGLGSTILVVENTGQQVHWMEPRDLQFDTMSFAINDPAGVSSIYRPPAVTMVDGTLRRLDDQLSPNVLRALITATGGEPLEKTGDGWQLLEDGRLRAKQTDDR